MRTDMSQTVKLMTATKLDGDATALEYLCDPMYVGPNVKNIVASIKVLQKSGTTVKVGLQIEHGPDGSMFQAHSYAIAMTTLGASYAVPFVINGATDTNTDGDLCEWIRPVVMVETASQWVVVEVYIFAKTV
jgi:hypothetical protein